MRLSFVQFVALAVFAPLAMIACDIPIPEGTAGGTVPEPVWTDDARVVTGELTDDDAERASGQKHDRVATVTVPAGHSLHVLMVSPTFDTYLRLEIEGTDQTVVNDDFNGSTRRSYISQVNPSDQTVEVGIWASAYASGVRGTYTLQFETLAPPEAPTANAISIPGRYSGTLSARTPEVPLLLANDARRADAYSFTLGSGQTATVRMESAAFDTYLKVLRNGAFAERNDDFAGSRSASQVELTQAGAYTVFAGTFRASGAGDYILDVQTDGRTPAPEASASEPSGESRTVEGGLTDDDDETALTLAGDSRKADAYSIDLVSGQTLVVELESPNFDTYLKLDFSGESVARNDDAGSTRRSAIRYRAVSGGTYTLYAGTFTSGGRGAYTLAWRVE